VETNRAWNAYNELNRRDEKMAHEWILVLKSWLESKLSARGSTCILDYGCGYFDLGIELAQKGYLVDGFDPFGPAVDIARARVEQLVPGRAQIYSSPNEIPTRRYDVIVLNSVVQYMIAENELQKFFAFSRGLFRNESGLVVISDIIPRGYSPILDGLEFLYCAARRTLLWPMLLHLYRTFQNKGHRTVRRYDFAELEELAESFDYDVTKLDCNLTPSKRRYTVVLQKKVKTR
jgi:SAM-dependent methyltransferase